MIRFTGIDGEKKVSVSWSPFKRRWEITSKSGRKIYTVPSDRVLIKREETDIRDPFLLKKALALEIEERFGALLWDVRFSEGGYCLALVKDYETPADAYALDPEPFALARAFVAIQGQEGLLLDIGRRKTTFVEIREGQMESYRVILKGTDFLVRLLAEKRGFSEGEAAKILLSEGLENPLVEEGFKRIISSIGKSLTEREILLSGGGAKLKGLRDLFKGALFPSTVEPTHFSALGSALKYVVKDCSPDFRKEELSERDLKRVALVLGASFLLFLAVNLSAGYVKKELTSTFREIERREFKRKFPDIPAVAVRDQVKSFAVGEGFPLSRKLLDLSKLLKEGVKIYRLEFAKDRLIVVGEAKSRELLSDLPLKKIKQTPEETYEFELEL